MENEIAVRQYRSAAEVVSDARLIQEVMKSVMKDKIHYGTIPGCGDKPTLFKPGAEKILSTFKIAVDPEIEDLSTGDVIRYRVKARGIHMMSGNVVGCGVGEASSEEEKYKWRKCYDEEYDATPDDHRRIKFGKYKTKQIRTNPADVANTVLKMAKKRAQIDLCLTATAASDCFAQDLEDLPEGLREAVAESDETPLTKPKAKEAPEDENGNGDTISEPQRKRFFAIWKKSGRTQEQVKEYLQEKFGSESSNDITKDGYNAACAWAESKEAVQEEVPFG